MVIAKRWGRRPYQANKKLCVNYTPAWTGLDLFKVESGETYVAESTMEASLTEGFLGDDELNAPEAIRYGLTVTANTTVKSPMLESAAFDVPAWTKLCVRPYIYYYLHTYQGTMEYYCYDPAAQRYCYIYKERIAYDVEAFEAALQVWSRTNHSKNRNAVSPSPPQDWER